MAVDGSMADPFRSSIDSQRSAHIKPGGIILATFDAKNIRNIILLGHSGCGKTSLVEALLVAVSDP